MNRSFFTFDKIYTEWNFERMSRHFLFVMTFLIYHPSLNNIYSDGSFFDWFLIELIIIPAKLVYVYIAIYYLMPKFLLKKRYGIFLFLLILGAGIWSIIGAYIPRFLDPLINNRIAEFLPYYYEWKKFPFKALEFVYMASLGIVIKLLQFYMTREKQLQLLSREKMEAELQALKNQLQPHFLFNTMNNLYGMVLTQDKHAPDVVLRLSEMMNYMLYDCDAPLISLEKEVDNLQNYISLEKIRYGDRLDISFETEGIESGQQIAPLLLLPFLENAFKHGPAKQERKSWIKCNIFQEGLKLNLLVENSLPDLMEPEGDQGVKSGIGLKNVKKRLSLLYPNRHLLEIKEDDSFLVRLEIEMD